MKGGTRKTPEDESLVEEGHRRTDAVWMPREKQVESINHIQDTEGETTVFAQEAREEEGQEEATCRTRATR